MSAVAQLSLRLALPARVVDRTTVLATYTGSFPPAPYVDCMVEWHDSGSPQSF